ncbi:MAG: HAMP domain-containing histidine kinase [Lachnospiraceae bacterium]|nr:HAMP domain-containing histidine kinase [Lachnospiraceae bacterium]
MSKEFRSPNLEAKTVEELTLQLIEAHSKLQALQKEREMMLANISHDLRAPITAIRSAVDLALSTDDLSEEDFKKTMNLIDRRTSTLEDLINDMYYLFCVEDNSRPLKTIEADACTFLEEYFYDAIVDSRYDAFDMQLDVPTDLKCTINVEPQKMVRVLDNLMTNSAKYAGEKATYIRLGARIAAGKAQTGPGNVPTSYNLRITVSDNGCGIAPEALPHIFTRTFTGSDARTPGTRTGSGLGLSIARAIVERHGGTIDVRSETGKGTEFTILLPCSCS